MADGAVIPHHPEGKLARSYWRSRLAQAPGHLTAIRGPRAHPEGVMMKTIIAMVIVMVIMMVLHIVTVIASHALAGDLKSREAFEAIAPYVIGGIAGSVIVAIAAKVLVPEPKSAKRARASRSAWRCVAGQSSNW